MGYPSLQGTAEFDDLPAAVATLDDVVLQAKAMREQVVRLARRVEQLPVKRRGRAAAADLGLELRTAAAKLDDTLAVSGLLSEPERSRGPNWTMGEQL